MRLEAINSTSVRVQWQPPLDRRRNGVIRGYQIHYAKTSEDENDGDVAYGSLPSQSGIYDTINGSVTEALIVGLQAETEYRVHVTAYTRRGDGVPSKVKRVRTKGAGLFRNITNIKRTHGRGLT